MIFFPKFFIVGNYFARNQQLVNKLRINHIQLTIFYKFKKKIIGAFLLSD